MAWFINLTTGKVTDNPSGNVESLKLFNTQSKTYKYNKNDKAIEKCLQRK